MIRLRTRSLPTSTVKPNVGTPGRERQVVVDRLRRVGDRELAAQHVRDGRLGSHRSPSFDVELARNRMAAIGRTPQDHKLAHPYAETGQVGHHASVCHQYQRRSTAVSSDGFLDLGKLALTEFHVVERALQDIPRLRLPEGQTGGVQASATRA